MLCFETNNFYHLSDWFSDFKGRVDGTEVVWAQLLQIEEVLNHECQKTLTCTVHVQRFGKFAVYGFQPFFEAVRMEVVRTDDLYEVTDLAHLHIHDKILCMDSIQRIACVMRGCSVHCGHEDFLFFLFTHMDCGGFVINLQYEPLLALTVDLLVIDLDVFEAAAVRDFLVFNRYGELVLESRQVKLFRFQKRQLTQGPVLNLLAFLSTHIVNFVYEVFLKHRQW